MAFFSFLRFLSRPSPKTRRPRLGRAQIGVEVLEGRSLPSATPMGMLAHHSDGGQHRDLQPDRHDQMRGDHQDAGKLEAHLTSATGALGSAEFNVTRGKLEVQVTGAAANATLNVVVDGNVLGQLVTNQAGNGSLEVSPVNPAVQAGSTITVGDLSGTFATEANKGEDAQEVEEPQEAARAELTATLTGASAAVSGTARIDGQQQEIKVSFKGAAADTTYAVTIDGVVVGQVTTDHNGRGRLELSPSNLPAVKAGSTITIGDAANPILQGTFTQSGHDD